jgi:oxygen-independent coproporphyrinogen-3 oxidase
MAGVYIHIPFCKVKCHYCDFHFSVQLKTLPKLVETIQLELVQQANYLLGEKIETIYFGGGTPSILSVSQVADLLETVRQNYPVIDHPEITFECNPDDIDEAKLRGLKQLGINRLSIGIQSFNEEVLKYMNRAHNSQQAKQSIELVKVIGFAHLTIDLMYGIPNLSMADWQQQVAQFLQYDHVDHVSAYCLTIEENTVFGAWHRQGKLQVPSDQDSITQFQYLMDVLPEFGYEQYEISNFAKNGAISKHNSAYWLGEKYLGVGPSAHSYNGNERQWNVANNGKYVNEVVGNGSYFELEKLSKTDQFNDYVLTRLRTKWGIDMRDLEKIAPEKMLVTKAILHDFLEKGDLYHDGSRFVLTDQGKYIADGISADLFI